MSRDLPATLRLAALALLAAGCSATPDLAPHLDRLEPAGGVADAAATVLVHGRGFYPRVVQSASGGQATVDTTQKAWLDGTPLDGVTWLGEETLRLTLPAGLALGPHALDVENALGRRTSLAGAWTVIDPAALSATAALSRAVASAGQPLSLVVTLVNPGGAAVEGATVSTRVQGSAAVLAGATPAAVTVPAGGSAEVVVPLTTPAPGAATLAVTVSGVEALTGRAVTAEASAGPVLVQARAALTASLVLPAAVDGATPFSVTMTVSNQGEAAALAVTPGTLALATGSGATLPALGGPAPEQADIPGGGTVTFTWQARLTSGGALALVGGAAGTDANDGQAVVAAPALSGTAVPQAVGALRIEDELTRSVASTTQAVGLHLTVKNTGPVAVRAIALTVTPGGTGGLSVPALPAPFDLGAGESFETVLPLTASAAGLVAVDVAAAGHEDPTGLPVAASRGAGSVTVQDRAALRASLAIPSTIPAGGAFTVTMTVFNDGGATVSAVAPDALALTADATTGLASLTGPTPAQADVPGQGSATFTWAARLQGAGAVELLGGAAGVDANDRLPVVAALVESNLGSQASEVSLVAADPFGDGSASGLLALHAGLLWLGPSADGTTLWRLDPATGAASTGGVSIATDQGSTGSENGHWYQQSPASTFGAAGCAAGTAACGPDDEGARGLLAGGAALGSDWLLYGASAGKKRQFVYLAGGTGASLAFKTVDLSSVVSNSVGGITAAAFVPAASGDRIYLAVTDSHAKKSPYLLELSTAPTGGWLDAGAGTDVVDLGAAKMPDVGGDASTLKNGDAQPRIDAMVQFRGLLYLGSGGGLMRAAAAQPRSYADQPGDWTFAGLGPLLPVSWLGKTSVEATGTSGLTPADRAVPAMAAYGTCGSGPCLYVARNVKGAGAQPAVVAQLWRCDPTKTAGSGASADACDVGDWALAAANTSGDKQLTQLGAATRGALSVLLATGRYLYVGLDDATAGAQLFRSQVASPAAIADFQGQNGCAAGTAGCLGLGGAGLGDAAVTRFLDARAVTSGGRTVVYVLAAGAAGAQKLFAVTE